MIRYPVTRAELEAEIELEKPDWLERTRIRTKKFVAGRKYREKTSIWGEIKAVYMRRQHNKCAYCERQLTSEDYGGAIEHDLEHYRPKNEVLAWPPAGSDEYDAATLPFPTGANFANGYFWLAYEPMNYVTVCKKCNSPLKRNFFPIAASRGPIGADLAVLSAEQPFLVYPLGESDEDPEELLTFSGILAIPRKKNGPRWRRARVMIEFFKLNIREELLRDRANQLIRLANALSVLENGHSSPDRQEFAQKEIERLQSPSSAHTNCVRAACSLYEQNPEAAQSIFDVAGQYLDGLS